MKLFGITGAIAMGKTTAGELLRQRGVAVIDTDVIARQLVEPGQPALAEISKKFGPSILLPDGQLDRSQLAQRVFSNESSRSALESILHPRIRSVWVSEVAAWRDAGRTFGAVVIPLLFETKAADMFDDVICVACSASTQARRLGERGLTPAGIKQRVEAQWAIDRKIAYSDFVVWTDTTLAVHAAQLALIVKSDNAPA